VSVVPVGLTKYREGLHPLEPFTKADALEVLKVIEEWQDKLYKEHGMHFIHAGDEWYILAGTDMPEEERYDGYSQLENGVGMLRLLENEFDETYQELTVDERHVEVSLATGALAYPYLEKLIDKLSTKYPNVTAHLYKIRNDFFGEKITVSGLITGQDLIAQLKGKPLGERLLLPCNMLRSGEEVFLDDVSISDVQETLQVQVDIVKSSGQDFIEAILGEDYE
jgi:NifB/MoaA-like Fe-S oxidoreductase